LSIFRTKAGDRWRTLIASRQAVMERNQPSLSSRSIKFNFANACPLLALSRHH